MKNALNTVLNRSKRGIDTDAADDDLRRAKALFLESGLSFSNAAHALGISKTAMFRSLINGKWPREAMRLKKDFVHWMNAQAKLAGLDSTSVPADPPVTEVETKGEDDMLFQKQTLTLTTRKHFKLPRNPFFNEIGCADDVFSTPDTRWIIESMLAQAKHGGMMALVGESGSGKTTLVQELKDRLKRESGKSGQHEIVLIEPGVIFMEENDTKGKTLKAEDIGKTIIATIAPEQSPRRDRQARYRQMVDLLTIGHRQHQRYALLIEEAHCMPLATLKHLKRFCEMKDGHAPLLSVILVGQPELRTRLSVREKEVREVAQRCDIYELQALGNDLESYLNHKFKRADADVKTVITTDAIYELQRLMKGCTYPLAVGNALIAAMNRAAEDGAPIVDVENIKG